jgi:hypothetical protein
MALIVKLYINKTPIGERSIVRIEGQPGEWCAYETDDGRIIFHHYNEGAEALARKLLAVSTLPLPAGDVPSR